MLVQLRAGFDFRLQESDMIPEKWCALTWQKLAVPQAAYAISALMALCRRVDTARVCIAYPATAPRI
jgi:hypothetical protein